MATVPTGYVFWDASAKKSYAAGATMPTVGDGDYMVPASTSLTDGYYQQYIYRTSYNECDLTIANGWHGVIQSEYYSKQQKAPFASIGGKPVKSFTYMNCKFTAAPNISGLTNLESITFVNCINMTAPPVLPPNLKTLQYAFNHCERMATPPDLSTLATPESIKSLYATFQGCYAMTSAPDISNLVNLETMWYAFTDCRNITNPPTISGLTRLENIGHCFEGCVNLITPGNYKIPDTVFRIGYAFKGCSAIINGPAIPENATDMTCAFQGCTSLSGFIEMNNVNSGNTVDMFKDTVNTVILVGTGATAVVARTGNNNNVYCGIVAIPRSFTAIRCDSSGEESATGSYCILTVSFKAPYIIGAKLIPPVLKKDGSIVSPTWRWNTKDGQVIDGSGVQLQSTGKIVAILSLGESTSAANLSLSLVTMYGDYDPWASEEINATLTYQEFIIDINSSGAGISFGGEAPDEMNGVKFDMPVLGLLNYIHPPGTLYETIDPDFDPNEVWGGVWKQLDEDAYLKIISPEETIEAGEYGGSNTIGTNNLPAHTHGSKSLSGTMNVRGGDTDGKDTLITSSSGIISRGTTTVSKPHHVMTTTSSGNVQYQTVTINATHEHDSVGGGEEYHPRFYGVYAWLRVA